MNTQELKDALRNTRAKLLSVRKERNHLKKDHLAWVRNSLKRDEDFLKLIDSLKDENKRLRDYYSVTGLNPESK
jgi:hypothetical protein